MCRNGYNVECIEDGCSNRVTCRDEGGMCNEHGYNSWLIDDDEPAFVSSSGQVVLAMPDRFEGDDN